MSSVTYASDHGTATGISLSRDGQRIFLNAPASVAISYTYDAGIQGIEHDGTTVFAMPDLGLRINVPGYWHAEAGPGTITWAGDTIHFDVASTIPYGYPPSVTIDVTFTAGQLTLGTLPSSLEGLEGIPGRFNATAQASLYYGGPGGQATGSCVSAPEPSTVLMLALGMIGCLIMGRRR